MNSALIIGVVLILLGLGLAVAAYMVITSRDEEDDLPELLEVDAPAEDMPAEDETGHGADEVVVEETEQPEADELETEPSIEPALMDAPEPDEEPEAQEEPESTQEKAEPAETPSDVDHIQVATLLRDDVTGQLIIQVGDREYSSPDELRASPDWTRVEYAAADLAEWVRPPASKETKEPESALDSEEQAAERRPSTMIEQINAILQERIELSGRSELAVRLIEGPGGMARVLIGVNSYEIAEVPDPEVRELIRQAVATWEASQ